MLPCEVLSKRLFPALRGVIARMLIEKHGLSVYETSKLLGLTPAAVSNYLSGKRGDKLLKDIYSNTDIMVKIEELVDKMAKGKAGLEDYLDFICTICIEVRKGKIELRELEEAMLIKKMCENPFSKGAK